MLIAEGTSGRLFEVTRKGEVVWEWISPFITTRGDGQKMSWVFRAYRYSLDDSGARRPRPGPSGASRAQPRLRAQRVAASASFAASHILRFR